MSFDLVLFGGTGDLAWRKLMPALFQAFRHGSLPPDGRIIGVARDDLSDDARRRMADWWAEDQRDRSGPGRHQAEEFGLDPEAIRDQFAFYASRFPGGD